MFNGDIRRSLPKIFGIYAAGFIVFILAMAGLARLGVGGDVIAILFVCVTVISYAVIGVLARTAEVDAFHVAGRQVPPLWNGMATAGNWIGAAGFIALAGGICFGGYSSLAFAVGWAGGFVLVNALLASYLRKAGCYTVPDFIGTRYGGHLTRLIALAILTVVSFAFLVAQIEATGIVAAIALDIPFRAAIWLSFLAILVCSALGGMRSVTWTQVAQYIVLIVAFLVPVGWMSIRQGWGVIPEIAYGDALQRLAALEAQIGLTSAAPTALAGLSVLTTPQTAPGGVFEAWQFVALALCMAAGTASLPHLLMRFFTTPSVRDARRSVTWALVFVFLVYVTAPALAVLVKLQVLDPTLPTAIVGKAIGDVASLDWVRQWSQIGFLRIADLNGDGILQIGEIGMRPDIVVLAMPGIAGLPVIVSGLVAAGAVAASMATASGLLLAIANALGHDAYYRAAEQSVDPRTRLTVARAVLVVFGAAATWAAMQQVTSIIGAVGWTFSFACSGLFFPLVLGVWWSRANRAGALAGMVFGFGAAAVYLWSIGNGMEPWYGIDELRFGIVGMPVSLIAMVAVSLLTPAPDPATREMVDEMRMPSGAPVLMQGR